MKDGKRCSGSIPYGYNRVPSDKQALVVDPVAAEVVKRIFLLANEGKSTRAIAEKLTEEKILIPSAYAKEYHPEQYNGQKYSNPNLWGMSTVRGILERQEYLGHTVLRKTVRNNIVVLWIVRLLALPVIALLYAAGFVLNLLYGICGSIGMVLAGLGGFAAFLALLDGSYAQAAASALVALLLCPFAAPMLLSLAGSALIVAASALFAWLY